jgi:hypothetical protein
MKNYARSSSFAFSTFGCSEIAIHQVYKTAAHHDELVLAAGGGA